MNTLALARRPGLLRRLADELHEREPRLAWFGLLMLVLMLPMALALGADERVLRGVNVWVKPMKFAASIALLALTTAWFIGHLEAAARRTRAVDVIVWMLIGAGSFELGYITLQATLGQASHYNVGDALHGAMYTLMGLGALALTATQPLLAWQLRRHAARHRPAVYRHAVQLGLVLTFVFGAGVGMLLSGLQPPDAAPGVSLPLLGWALQGGDLRPAHFVGIHAQQALPLIGLLLAARGGSTKALGAATLGYAVVFLAALGWGLIGRL